MKPKQRRVYRPSDAFPKVDRSYMRYPPELRDKIFWNGKDWELSERGKEVERELLAKETKKNETS